MQAGSVLVGHDEDQVAGLGLGGPQQAGPLVVGEEPVERRVERQAAGPPSSRRRDPEPGQPLGAEGLRLVGQGVEPGPGEGGAALEAERLDARRGERPHLGAGEHR